MTEYTWKKCKIPSVKTGNPYVKKRKEISRILQQKDTFAVLNLQFYNFYLKSNAYVAALGNIDPAERPEIKFFDVQSRRMYL